jgi:hypothetical protein
MKLPRAPILVLVAVSAAATCAAPAGSAPVGEKAATALRQTKTAVVCRPDVLRLGGTSDCTARVTDTGSGKKSPPAGTVTFTSNASGSFELASCTLEASAAAAATCTATYRPAAIGNGAHVVTAAYGGSETHNPTSGQYEVSVTPVNDARRSPTPLRAPPSAIDGTTVGATADYSDPEAACGELAATVWYSLVARTSGRIAVRLRARGKLDAVVSVFRVVRSQFRPLGCVPTDEKGMGGIAFQAARRGRYLIVVGEQERSTSSTFRLELFAPPLAVAPGARLPSRGVGAFVDPLTKPESAWSAVLREGVSYRMNLAADRGRCLSLYVFGPATPSFVDALAVREASCGGYLVLTPGPGRGGRYSLLVRAHGNRGETQRFRLRVAPTGRDDTAPGLAIENGQTRGGSLSGQSIDVVDLYRFAIDHRTDVTARLGWSRHARFDLLLLSGEGSLLRCACAARKPPDLRARLEEGEYFIAVRARGQSAGRYRLGLLIREITTTVALVDRVADAATAELGRAVELSSEVTPAAAVGGRVLFRIDRFDPIEGWQYVRTLTARVGSSGRASRTWSPPTVGRWRVRALFVGTRSASPSASTHVPLLVSD